MSFVTGRLACAERSVPFAVQRLERGVEEVEVLLPAVFWKYVAYAVLFRQGDGFRGRSEETLLLRVTAGGPASWK